jgi:hypothetical protein
VPKATFDDFLAQNPNCSKFAGNEDVKLIFDFLSEDLKIILMLEASDAGKPALTPWAKHLENLLLHIETPSISFDDNFTKQTVGLMVKCILAPFGYDVWKQRSLPKSAESTKFQSASVYRRNVTKAATLRIAKCVEEV